MKLTELENIGKEMEEKLNKIGITSADELKKIGSQEAFIRLKSAYPKACLVYLYTLQAAIDGVPFNMLSDSTKKDLKAFNDQLK